jgi:hypothetical protein
MAEVKYINMDTIDKASCTTFNFTVPSIWPLWVILFITVVAVVINYLITFRLWIFEKSKPSENFTNCDYYNENNYYNENDYYKQYQ